MNETWRARIRRKDQTDLVFMKLKTFIYDRKLHNKLVGPKIVVDSSGQQHIKVQCPRAMVRILTESPGVIAWETDTASYGGF